jgi:glycosyltransferase involved in cell wall biosynthesis
VCRERVVAYGTAGPADQARKQIDLWRASLPELGSAPFWLFLGRIHPKKGVDLLLRAYCEIAAASNQPLPTLVLAGPVQDQRYRATLARIAESVPNGSRILWPGMLEGERKWGALRSAEAFILPSHQENFGIAVVEALAAGTPTLISKKVNIWEEIVSAGAGIADTDNFNGTVRLLQNWRMRTPPEREQMRANAIALFKDQYEIGRVASSLIETITPFVGASRLLPTA